MPRIMMRVAYDGTEYSGWQVQPNAITIEGVLNAALSELTGEEIQVIGASRTDAGVHSLGNVCVFDTNTRIPPEKICFAVNNKLPQDIRVIESGQVPDDFHPRHCDSVKTYEYRIWNDKFPSPTLRRESHFTYRKINVDNMRAAAEKLVGEHDFGAFCGAGSQAETTVRTIYNIEIIEEEREESVSKHNELNTGAKKDADDGYQFGRMIRIRVTGTGFLYNMVRIIAGTLLDIGTGLLDVDIIDKCLETHDRADAGPTAPACGLTMIGIRFPITTFDEFIIDKGFVLE